MADRGFVNVLPWRLLRSALAAILFAAAPGLATAALVPYADTVIVRGTQLDVIELDFQQAGNYSIGVTDQELFSTPLSALSFTLFHESTPVLPPVVGSGTVALYISAAGTRFLQIYARAPAATTFGLYNVNVTGPAVVPLPASIYMLASILGLLYPLWRRRLRNREHEAIVSPA